MLFGRLRNFLAREKFLRCSILGLLLSTIGTVIALAIGYEISQSHEHRTWVESCFFGAAILNTISLLVYGAVIASYSTKFCKGLEYIIGRVSSKSYDIQPRTRKSMYAIASTLGQQTNPGFVESQDFKTFPKEGQETINNPFLQLIVAFCVLTWLLVHYLSSWWPTLTTEINSSSVITLNEMRLPGLLILSRTDDPFSANLNRSTQPPACGYLDWYPDLKECPSLNNASAACDCTAFLAKDYSSTITFNEESYDVNNLTISLTVTKPQANAQFWVWPNTGKQQVNVPINETNIATCNRNYLYVAFQGMENNDEATLGIEQFLQQPQTQLYPLPTGNFYHVQLTRLDRIDIKGKVTSYYSPRFSTGMPSGDCSVYYDLSYETLDVQTIAKVYKNDVATYVGTLGGILSIIQSVVVILVGIVLLLMDLHCT